MDVAKEAIIPGPSSAHSPVPGAEGGWPGRAQPNSAVPAAGPCAGAALRALRSQMGTPTVLPADLRGRAARYPLGLSY